jgi:predicted O-methyltransferase YrrM
MGLQVKRELVARLKPRSICEIGVRAGYSAFALLTVVPEARFLGIDIGVKAHGPAEPLREHALKLTEHFPHVTMMYDDSHTIDVLTPPVDLFHIDGDHSRDGCYQDLELALRSGARWALLDDVSHRSLKGVRVALDDFCATQGLRMEMHDDKHNGTALVHLLGEGGP